jgi:hypothetical protein
MMLLAFVVIVSLMSPLCDCAWPETEIALGSKCSFPAECQPGPITKSRHCCEAPPNGKYCSGCCMDDDCRDGRICIPFSWFQTDLTSHNRVCARSKVSPSSAPCFRNEQCISMHCNGGLGVSGDKVNYPLGKCA